MNIGDIVVVVDSKAIPQSFLGSYGRVTALYEYKVLVEFNQSIGSFGSLSHTAYPSDLKKVGEVHF